LTQLQGIGGHVKKRPIGHAWDVGLNEEIKAWMKKTSCRLD
jgi:hypothetical protein